MGRGKFLEAFMSGGSDKPAPDASDSGDMADEADTADEGGGDDEGGASLFRVYRKAMDSGDDLKAFKAFKRLVIYADED